MARKAISRPETKESCYWFITLSVVRLNVIVLRMSLCQMPLRWLSLCWVSLFWASRHQINNLLISQLKEASSHHLLLFDQNIIDNFVNCPNHQQNMVKVPLGLWTSVLWKVTLIKWQSTKKISNNFSFVLRSIDRITKASAASLFYVSKWSCPWLTLFWILRGTLLQVYLKNCFCCFFPHRSLYYKAVITAIIIS